jgi:hypothetical protein
VAAERLCLTPLRRGSGCSTGGKTTRGTENQVTLLAVVSFGNDGHPVRATLTLSPGRREIRISRLPLAHSAIDSISGLERLLAAAAAGALQP